MSMKLKDYNKLQKEHIKNSDLKRVIKRLEDGDKDTIADNFVYGWFWNKKIYTYGELLEHRKLNDKIWKAFLKTCFEFDHSSGR